MSKQPSVSIIIPCRNEEEYIGKCLSSIIANDYPKSKLEVLVIDGRSQDKTRKIIKQCQPHYPFIKLLDNPLKITPVAFNLGIKKAGGQLIMIMSSHCTYATDYISKSVKYLKKYKADSVGGVWKILPRKNRPLAKAITLALSHPFGVGNTHYRISSSQKPRWTDAVAFGCYKKTLFKKIGLFNEKLIRGQDMEFNQRLKKAGGKILLAPDIIAYYYARTNFWSFCKHNFKNGTWAILPFKYSQVMPVALRHLTPLIAVITLIILTILTIIIPVFGWLLLGLILVYFLANIYASVKITLRQKRIIYLLIMPITFTSLHLTYGLGSFWGLIKLFLPYKN